MTDLTKTRRMARTPSEVPVENAAAAPKSPTKQSQVLDLLRRTKGAPLSDIVDATGWLPHTARAALTGLKKKGHAIESRRVDKLTTYFLA